MGFKHSMDTYRTINGVRWVCVTAGCGSLLVPALRQHGIPYRLYKSSDDIYCHPDDVQAACELFQTVA